MIHTKMPKGTQVFVEFKDCKGKITGMMKYRVHSTWTVFDFGKFSKGKGGERYYYRLQDMNGRVVAELFDPKDIEVCDTAKCDTCSVRFLCYTEDKPAFTVCGRDKHYADCANCPDRFACFTQEK